MGTNPLLSFQALRRKSPPLLEEHGVDGVLVAPCVAHFNRQTLEST